MSERPSESSGLTSGDPLAGEQPPPRQDPEPTQRVADDPLWSPDPEPVAGSPLAPERPAFGSPLGTERPAAESPLAPEQPAAGSPVGTAPGGYGPQSPAPPGAGGSWLGGLAAPAALGGHVLSGWWRRAGALLIDGLIVGLGALVLFLGFSAIFSVGFAAGEGAGYASLVFGLILWFMSVALIALLYAPAMMARTNGRTLGRIATGIRVVRADGAPITFGFAMVREVLVKSILFGFLSSITLGLAHVLDVLWPLWDEENRALHDFVVNTRTIVV